MNDKFTNQQEFMHKIAEVISKYDLKPDTNKYMTDWQCRDLAQDIAYLIAKELPKEKDNGYNTIYGGKELYGYNQCLKDIKHKLGVER